MTEPPSEPELVVHIPEKVPLRFIAMVEFGKGLLAILLASGFAAHKAIGPVIKRLGHHLHFDPASDSPNAFVRAVNSGASAHARLIAAGVMFYAAIRIAEGIGLWYDKRWASWVGFLGAVVYLPFAIVEYVRHPSWLTAAIIAVTSGAVLFLAYHLRLRLKRA
jgi:uncharacterized membrane protein (DUF2068 family)